MQYIDEHTNDDLKPGYKTFVLKAESDRVKFFAYQGELATGAFSKEAQAAKADLAKYFLRKGFLYAIEYANPEIMTPMYSDNDGNSVVPQSKEEAIALIYRDKLNVEGFKFSQTATNEQKESAFASLIDSFVNTSQGLEFASDKNLFMVIHSSGRTVAYNNGGHSSLKINGEDVQEKLKMDTPEVMLLQKMRSLKMQNMIKGK